MTNPFVRYWLKRPTCTRTFLRAISFNGCKCAHTGCAFAARENYYWLASVNTASTRRKSDRLNDSATKRH